MMDLVIDIQCLKDTDNNNTPKEIALVALNGDFSPAVKYGYTSRGSPPAEDRGALE